MVKIKSRARYDEDDGSLMYSYEYYDSDTNIYGVFHGFYQSYHEDGTINERVFHKHDGEIGFSLTTQYNTW